MSLAVVILAAGQGTRMKSKDTKDTASPSAASPWYSMLSKPLIQVADLPPLLVIGPGEAGVKHLFGDGAAYVVQPRAARHRSRSTNGADPSAGSG